MQISYITQYKLCNGATRGNPVSTIRCYVNICTGTKIKQKLQLRKFFKKIPLRAQGLVKLSQLYNSSSRLRAGSIYSPNFSGRTDWIFRRMLCSFRLQKHPFLSGAKLMGVIAYRLASLQERAKLLEQSQDG